MDTAPSIYHWPSIDSAGKYVGAAEVAAATLLAGKYPSDQDLNIFTLLFSKSKAVMIIGIFAALRVSVLK